MITKAMLVLVAALTIGSSDASELQHLFELRVRPAAVESTERKAVRS